MTGMSGALPRTAPLRALPRTAPLRGMRGEPALAVGTSGSVAAPQTPQPASVSASVVTRAERARPGARSVIVWQAALYIALNLGDVVSTYLGLRRGLVEGNPLMATLLAHDGFDALIIYKFTIMVVALLGLWLLNGWSARAAHTAARICNVVVALVVMLNFAQIALWGR